MSVGKKRDLKAFDKETNLQSSAKSLAQTNTSTQGSSGKKERRVGFFEEEQDDIELRPKQKKQKTLQYIEESEVEESSYQSSEDSRDERERQFRLATNYDEDGNCINEINPEIEVLSASEEGDYLNQRIENLIIPNGKYTKSVEHIFVQKEHDDDNPFEGGRYSDKVALSSGVKDLAHFLNQ